jgi:hypothetical protein
MGQGQTKQGRREFRIRDGNQSTRTTSRPTTRPPTCPAEVRRRRKQSEDGWTLDSGLWTVDCGHRPLTCEIPPQAAVENQQLIGLIPPNPTKSHLKKLFFIRATCPPTCPARHLRRRKPWRSSGCNSLCRSACQPMPACAVGVCRPRFSFSSPATRHPSQTIVPQLRLHPVAPSRRQGVRFAFPCRAGALAKADRPGLRYLTNAQRQGDTAIG